jgi:hypothetical protein
MSKENRLALLVEPEGLLELTKIDDFLAVVNMEPPQQFVKPHPMVSGVTYLPIDKVEMMLTKVFQLWRVEILREGQMLNSIFVTVRLHYKHPITNDLMFQDGTGAAPIQTDKGKSAADLAAIKNDAIMKALPAAESYAVKDAAEKIGRVFGRDLNRKDTLGFTPSYGTEETRKKIQDSINSSLGKVKTYADSQGESDGGTGNVAGATPGQDNREEVEAGQAAQ